MRTIPSIRRRQAGTIAFCLAAALALGTLALPSRSSPPRSSIRAAPSRSARPLQAARQHAPATFEPAQSAALFVGIRHFANDAELAEVPYAVDDAIDLAYLVALGVQPRLVPPDRLVLALSGEAQKQQSRQRLRELEARGAKVQPADYSNVLSLLERQAATAGRDGILIFALATHGFSDDSHSYLATASTILRHRETALSADRIFAIAAASAASRRLVFLDACREHLTAARQVEADPRSRAGDALVRAIAEAQGQVVFFAAPVGGYAYDDEVRKNGVFTAAVLDGLRCAAPTDARGLVTVETLHAFVNARVTDWLKKNRAPALEKGISPLEKGIAVNLGGAARNIPLVSCATPLKAAPRPAIVNVVERFVNVLDQSGARLWSQELEGRIAQAEIALLADDASPVVVVGVDSGGEDTGKVVAFSSTGNRLWSVDTNADSNYPGGHSGKLGVRSFVVADLFQRGTRQIVTLSQDIEAWYPSRLCIVDGDGRLLSSYWHPGHLHRLIVGAPSAQDAPRIIVAGLNNDLRQVLGAGQNVGGVFMLDPRNVRGEAPPYYGKSGHGTQLWYGVLVPGDQQVETLRIADRDGNGSNQISVWTSTHHVHYLDFSGGTVASAQGDGALGSSRFVLLGENR